MTIKFRNKKIGIAIITISVIIAITLIVAAMILLTKYLGIWALLLLVILYMRYKDTVIIASFREIKEKEQNN
jgi:hypothetical protein